MHNQQMYSWVLIEVSSRARVGFIESDLQIEESLGWTLEVSWVTGGAEEKSGQRGRGLSNNIRAGAFEGEGQSVCGGVAGVEAVWSLKSEMARKVRTGQIGLDCPPEELASI